MGAKPSWIRRAAVTATGVPKPAAPSKKAPRQNAIPITWMRGSGERRARLGRRAGKRPLQTVRADREMRIRANPPGREKAEAGPDAGGGHSARGGQAERPPA